MARTLFDSFWRAAAYCLHPRVVLLSLLPLLLMGGLSFGLAWFFWEDAVAAVHAWLMQWNVLQPLLGWLDAIGWTALRAMLAPLVIVALSTPLIVLLCLLAVAALMAPAMVGLVAKRRFPTLERRHGGSLLGGIFGAAWATVVALVLLVLSMPLWLLPPLVLVLPPLIWGWLAYRVMSYDALAEHATKAERVAIVQRHRWPLLAIGVVTGYLGAAPSLVWASGAMSVVLAPLLLPVAVWIYTLVFAFSSLWFAHYALAALQSMRAAEAVATPSPLPMVEVVEPAPPPSQPPLGHPPTLGA